MPPVACTLISLPRMMSTAFHAAQLAETWVICGHASRQSACGICTSSGERMATGVLAQPVPRRSRRAHQPTAADKQCSERSGSARACSADAAPSAGPTLRMHTWRVEHSCDHDADAKRTAAWCTTAPLHHCTVRPRAWWTRVMVAACSSRAWCTCATTGRLHLSRRPCARQHTSGTSWYLPRRAHTHQSPLRQRLCSPLCLMRP